MLDPETLRPMLATPGPLPRPAEGWAFEVKWDGIRALAFVRGGTVRLVSRNGNDLTAGYPELEPLAALGVHDAVLDGEIVALDDHGRPSFQLLQRRGLPRQGGRRPRIVYVVFDVLVLDGESLVDQPYERRRIRLGELDLPAPARTSPSTTGDPGPITAFAREHGLEGVVSKRLDSRYERGRRSRAWIKTKFSLRQELVVGGWLEGQGGRTGRLGALLVGYHASRGDRGPLQYAGRVGTGFTETELDRLGALLTTTARDTSPFTGSGVPRGARFVEPSLVVEVRFTEWTADGRIRHPVYLGPRDDKDPADVVRETP